MKRRFLHAFAIALFIAGAAGFSACGSGNPDVVLTVVPSGPTIVMKGDTLQLTANITNVTWSVQGGDGNGTINAAGLYTPPTTLPVTSTVVTVMAESTDGQVATASIDLRTGIDITFGAPLPVNDTPLPGSLAAILFLIEGGVSDRHSVRLGSVQVDAAWPGINTVVNPFYAQSLDLGAFSPEENILVDPVTQFIPTSVETDSQENPMVIGTAGTNGRIQILVSDDQGATFNPPIPIASSSPVTAEQHSPYARLDKEDGIHVVFTEVDTAIPNAPTNVFYTMSADGGTTWSPPQPVSTVPDDSVDVLVPALAVDPDGGKIYVCWNQGSLPGEIFFSASADGGDTFSTPTAVSDSAVAGFCRVARGPTGDVFVSYAVNDMGGSGVFLQRSTDGGATFGDPLPVNSEDPNISTIAMMAVDDLGRIDVVWTADPEANDMDTVLMYARSLNNGAAFSEQVPVTPLGVGATLAASGFRHDATGRLYLQYWQIESGATNVFMTVGE